MTFLVGVLLVALCAAAAMLILGDDSGVSAASAVSSVEVEKDATIAAAWEGMCTRFGDAEGWDDVCRSVIINASRVERGDERGVESPPGVRDVVVLIDALRPDMLLSPLRFPFFNSLVEEGERTGQRLVSVTVAVASPPTVTLPKVKTILTGKDSSFIDLFANFAAPELTASNVLHLAVTTGRRRLAFYGDDTWLKLFPTDGRRAVFTDAKGVFSFDVTDFAAVDDNVTVAWRELLGLPPQQASRTQSKSVDGLIVHYLGLDHIGHTLGPASERMLEKQREMDSVVIEPLYRTLCARDPNARIVILSDHGMARAGGHGGSTVEEVNTVLAVMRCRGDVTALGSHIAAADDGEDASPESITLRVQIRSGNDAVDEEGSVVQVPRCTQIDVASALSVLFQSPLGPRFPTGSRGFVPTHTLAALTPDVRTAVAAQLHNAWHLARLCLASGLGDAAVEVLNRARDPHQLHDELGHPLQEIVTHRGEDGAVGHLMMKLSVALPLGIGVSSAVLLIAVGASRPMADAPELVVVFGSALLMLSSSFAEEEHLLYFGLSLGGSAAWMLVGGDSRCMKRWLTLLVAMRVAFGWAHSGTKWMVSQIPVPAISPWLGTLFGPGWDGQTLIEAVIRALLGPLTSAHHDAALISLIVIAIWLVFRDRSTRTLMLLVLCVAPLSGIVPLVAVHVASAQLRGTSHPPVLALVLVEAAFYAPGRSILLSNMRFDHLMYFHTVAVGLGGAAVQSVSLYVVVGPLLFLWHHAGRIAALPCGTPSGLGKALLLRHCVQMCVLTLGCLFLREHLFYWTVFLPKLLFGLFDALFVVALPALMARSSS